LPDLDRLVAVTRTGRGDEAARVVPALIASLPRRPAAERHAIMVILADLLDVTRSVSRDRDLVATVIPVVSAHVADPDARVRATAVEGLGRLRATAAITALRRAAVDPAGPVRQAAAWALGSVMERHTIAPLVPLLSDEDPTVRVQAAQALGCRAHRDALDLLCQAVGDPYPAVRRYAVVALGWLLEALSIPQPPPLTGRPLDHLLALLTDQDTLVRVHAVAAVGGLHDRRLMEPLRRRLQDPAPAVRHAATRELVSLGLPVSAIDPPPISGPDEEILAELAIPADAVALPQDLRAAIAHAVTELHHQTYHDLDAPLRLAIYRAFGSPLHPVAQRARGLLALWAAARVRPIAALAYSHADVAIEMAADVIAGVLVPSAATEYVSAIAGGDWSYGCVRSPWSPTVARPTQAAEAAHLAAYEAAGLDVLAALGSDMTRRRGPRSPRPADGTRTTSSSTPTSMTLAACSTTGPGG
jgi:HEAT repeat protein